METSDNKIKYFQYGFAFVAAIMVFNAYKSMELRNHEVSVNEKKELIRIVDKSVEAQIKALTLINKALQRYDKDTLHYSSGGDNNAVSSK